MTAPLGWGIDPYGTSLLGSTLHGADLFLVSAVAISTHDVQVTLSLAPRHLSASGPGDALNPATWVVQRVDTAEFFDIAEVVEESATVYTLHTLQPFGSVAVLHNAGSNSLLSLAGAVLGTPRIARFLGVSSAQTAEDALIATLNITPRDVANPQVPRDDQGEYGGTLQIDSSGDYVPVSGGPFVRKMIFRRLTTARGEFFHLPNYGIDFPVKEPIRAGELPLLKAEIERQIKREPEVVDVRAVLTMAANGVLTAKVRARLKSGGALDETINLPLRAAT